MTLTHEDVKHGRAINRLHSRLDSENADVARMGERLALVRALERKEGWEVGVAGVLAQRDQAQADLDEAYRTARVHTHLSTSTLVTMMRARLRHWKLLDWVSGIERLGGQKARTVLPRVEALESMGGSIDACVDPECPVVRAMHVQDMNPKAFRMKPARGAGGGVNPAAGRGLERDTGAVG